MSSKNRFQKMIYNLKDDLSDGLQEAQEEIHEAIEDVREELEDLGLWRSRQRQTTSSGKRKNMSYPTEDDIRRNVEKRLKARRELSTHILVFCLVIPFLWVIWLLTDTSFLWPIIPMLGWGIGIIAHGFGYYYEHGEGRRRREEIIERETRRELERHGYKPKNSQSYDDAFIDDEGELYFDSDTEKRKRANDE
jgi:hypothetical protein